MASKRILLLCGDFTEDYEVTTLFFTRTLLLSHSCYQSFIPRTCFCVACRPWFHFRHCRPSVSPLTPCVPEGKPVMSAAPPSMEFTATRSLSCSFLPLLLNSVFVFTFKMLKLMLYPIQHFF